MYKNSTNINHSLTDHVMPQKERYAIFNFLISCKWFEVKEGASQSALPSFSFYSETMIYSLFLIKTALIRFCCLKRHQVCTSEPFLTKGKYSKRCSKVCCRALFHIIRRNFSEILTLKNKLNPFLIKNFGESFIIISTKSPISCKTNLGMIGTP